MDEVLVTGVGAVSPVGLSAPATAAALRAGIARLGPIASSTVVGDLGVHLPVTGGRVPLEWLRGGPDTTDWPGHQRFGIEPPEPEEHFIPRGVQRLVDLALPACREAWARTGRPGAVPDDWGLFLGLDEADDATAVTEALRTVMSPWRPAQVRVCAHGRAAALEALHEAAGELRARRLAGALVGGVDSLVRPEVYLRLRRAGRMKDVDDHPQGVLPGEAAAFLALEPAGPGGSGMARLLGTAIAPEPTAGTDRPCQGRGLTDAVRGAVRASPGTTRWPLVICDLDGDRYRALEWSLAVGRSLGDLTWHEAGGHLGSLWHPADSIGDTGAASGALDGVWAVLALAGRYTDSERVLVWGASDGALRAAAMMAAGGG